MRQKTLCFIVLVCLSLLGCSKQRASEEVVRSEASGAGAGRRGEAVEAEPGRAEVGAALARVEVGTILAKAEGGDAEAMYVLSGLYMSGEGILQDDEAALMWTMKAAEAGHVDARFEVAASALEGDGGMDAGVMYQWFSEAAEKYKREANRGDIKAQQRLAWMYETGKGVEKSEQQAELWQVEATRGMYEQGMTVEPEALYNLGVAYYQGDVIAKNDFRAAEIFKLTAALGLPQAQYSLALFYTSGTVVEQNDAIACGWFTNAAKQGHDKAQFEVAQRYYYGYVVGKDLKAAFEWFEKSANNGNVKSQLMLGMMYGKGEVSGEPDYERAAFWLEMAKDDTEYPIGKAFLGKMYINGDGVKRDKEKGLKLLREAASLGDETAIQALRGIGLEP